MIHFLFGRPPGPFSGAVGFSRIGRFHKSSNRSPTKDMNHFAFVDLRDRYGITQADGNDTLFHNWDSLFKWGPLGSNGVLYGLGRPAKVQFIFFRFFSKENSSKSPGEGFMEVLQFFLLLVVCVAPGGFSQGWCR